MQPSTSEMLYRIGQYIVGKDISKIKAYLRKHYRTEQFSKLRPDQVKEIYEKMERAKKCR